MITEEMPFLLAQSYERDRQQRNRASKGLNRVGSVVEPTYLRENTSYDLINDSRNTEVADAIRDLVGYDPTNIYEKGTHILGQDQRSPLEIGVLLEDNRHNIGNDGNMNGQYDKPGPMNYASGPKSEFDLDGVTFAKMPQPIAPYKITSNGVTPNPEYN